MLKYLVQKSKFYISVKFGGCAGSLSLVYELYIFVELIKIDFPFITYPDIYT